MPKATAHYMCQACGAVTSKWAGRCEACGEWNSIIEEKQEITPKGLTSGKGKKLGLVPLSIEVEDAPRRETGVAELDRVLGGGLVEGSAVLIGGDPGIGKSTLLLQAAVRAATGGLSCVYVTGEESVAQVSLRARRLGLVHPGVSLAAATSVRDILASLDAPQPPDMVVIDSVQTMVVDNIEAAPGTVSQVRAASHELIRLAKRRGFTLFLVGHVTKDGQIAGPRVLEHMVDTVLYFEGERAHPYRILRAVKNRFGGTDEIGVFTMTDLGLQEVANPSALFLSERSEHVSGASVFAGMEGSRPLLVEIQALVTPSYMSSPRRAVVGWDGNRLAMVLAVLETRLSARFSDQEVYLNVAGGLRIGEPAADLAVAAALLSAQSGVPIAADTVIFGEIGLSGEVRRVSRTEARLKEAEKLGFKKAVCNAAAPATPAAGGLKVRMVTQLAQLAEVAKPGAPAYDLAAL